MKPIIMSTEDVRATLDRRKTMFRQVMKPQPTYWDDGERLYDKDNIVGPEFYNPIRVDKDGEQYPGKEVYGIYSDNGEYGCKAPYNPGDVLLVRETWARLYYVDPSGYTHFDHPMLFYRADGSPDITLYDDNGFLEEDQRIPWRSPVTMPREAARLFLRVKDVRVERVQDISDDGSIKEGCTGVICDHPKWDYVFGCADCMNSGWREPPRLEFSARWDARNAKRGYGWDSNPLIWVIEFERTPSGVIGPEQGGMAPNGDKGAES